MCLLYLIYVNYSCQKNDEILAKLRKEITDEKNKCDRIRKIAKKYKESGNNISTYIMTQIMTLELKLFCVIYTAYKNVIQ